ncbi:MAG: hypothetical protein R3B90_15770 [Planctomycetaceae bacterium]
MIDGKVHIHERLAKLTHLLTIELAELGWRQLVRDFHRSSAHGPVVKETLA